jgi:hypothetical protein
MIFFSKKAVNKPNNAKKEKFGGKLNGNKNYLNSHAMMGEKYGIAVRVLF